MAKAPGYLRVRSRSGTDRRLVDVSIRWWHPSIIPIVLKAIVRHVGYLRPICSHCGGAGRLVKSQLFRRERCFVCDGTGREPAPTVRLARWERRMGAKRGGAA